jgi:hypothetical protein
MDISFVFKTELFKILESLEELFRLVYVTVIRRFGILFPGLIYRTDISDDWFPVLSREFEIYLSSISVWPPAFPTEDSRSP